MGKGRQNQCTFGCGSFQEFNEFGVQYSKIFCPGREIPSDDVYAEYVQEPSY